MLLRGVHITCQHKSDEHESLGKMMGKRAGAGRGSGTVSAQLSLAYSLSLYSAQTESKERALVAVWERRKKRGSRVTMAKRDTTHRAAEMQRPPDDLPSAAPRSPPPRPPQALRLHNTSQEKETADEKGRGVRGGTFCTF